MTSSQPRRHWRTLQIAVCVTALLGGPTPALAQMSGNALRAPLAESAGPGKERARKTAERDSRPKPNVAPGEAARRASREYGGRVLNVVLEDGPGGPYYRVKLLDGGRVRVVHVEARH
ncbi:hypothetical protein SADO_09367 [Salinisphaera dokdonensis CL-ES53]|uniref:PepSY domain-containing protein n=1 Tax=Salinisphaera dokdonensis CL-ES53 TaxID=1304272 RepID=A0ABV2B0N8_9GAMM